MPRVAWYIGPAGSGPAPPAAGWRARLEPAPYLQRHGSGDAIEAAVVVAVVAVVAPVGIPGEPIAHAAGERQVLVHVHDDVRLRLENEDPRLIAGRRKDRPASPRTPLLWIWVVLLRDCRFPAADERLETVADRPIAVEVHAGDEAEVPHIALVGRVGEAVAASTNEERVFDEVAAERASHHGGLAVEVGDLEIRRDERAVPDALHGHRSG